MRTVWEIGDVDGDGGRFAGRGLTSPGDDEVELAVTDPGIAHRLPRVHPGPLAAYAGAEDKRLVLTFDLPGQPAAPHRLALRMFALQGPVPDLEIGVNGRRGRYFPSVRREDRRGIPGVSAISGWVDLAIPLPAHWLSPGANAISITTVCDEGVEPIGGPHPELPGFWGSAVEHVGIRLDELDEPASSQPSVTLTPLPLYVDRDVGLAELADLVVTVAEPVGDASAVVEVGGTRIEAALELGDRDFGQARVRLEVPEQPMTTPATVTVRLDEEELVHATTFRPCRKWTLHLLPHVHLDLGYTDFQAKVAEIHARNLDRVLAILDRQPDYAYSVDGSYVVQQFLRTRSGPSVERLRRAVTDGSISVNAFYALFLTGLATLEECFRAGTHAAAMRRDHGLPIAYANLTDVPSYSGALPTVLRAMGIDAFLGIQNHGRAANDDSDELHLRSPFRWRGPDGAEVLTFFADCYAQLRYFCGYPVSVQGAAHSLTRLLGRFERDDYLPSDFPIVGTCSDNEDLADGEADLVARWAKTYAYPRLRFSTVSDYFAAVRPLLDQLPAVRGDGGSYWEDGVGAGAAIIADYRRAQVGLASAEALATLLSAADADLRPSLDDLDPAWDQLLIGCEHTWTSMHAPQQPHGEQTVDQLAWKAHQVAGAGRVATDETRRALSQLGERITTDGPSLVVANTLGWTRDVEVEVELPGRRWPAAVDGVVVEEVDTIDGLTTVRLLVRDVPGLGYRSIALRPAGGPGSREPARPTLRDCDGPLRVETRRYVLGVEGGRLTSLYAKRLGRELLDPHAAFSLGEVVYVRLAAADGDRPAERTRLFDTNRELAEPDLRPVPAAMRVVELRQGPTGTVVTLRGSAPSLPVVEVDVRLREDADRVDLDVRLEKEAVLATESVYVAFPFAVDDPTVRYDRQVGWVDPAVDHLPGACNEWFTTLFGAAVSNDELAVTWCSRDAPLFTVGDIVRGRWPTRPRFANGTIFSWVMNNHWWTNFPPSQEGKVEARYAFTPAPAWDVVEASRFGRDVRVPAAAGTVGWLDKMDTAPRPLPADGAPLLEVHGPRSVLATVVAARREPGVLLRLEELAGAHAEVEVHHPHGPGATAGLVSALEDPVSPLRADAQGRLRVAVGPHQLVSVHLSSSGAPERR